MENKGYDSIVGARNARSQNSLTNGNGDYNNYYAIIYPSLPNYYAMVGGTDFGKTYNCRTYVSTILTLSGVQHR